MTVVLVSSDELTALDDAAAKLLQEGDVEQVELWDADMRIAFGRYLLFSSSQDLVHERLSSLSSEDAFYNSYYWFQIFVYQHKLRLGADAGLEQQSFKLLENAPPNVNWAWLEKIAQKAENEAMR